MTNVHPALPSLVAALARIPSVEAVILFGSRARRDNRPRSDIDLAVHAPHLTSTDWSAVMSAIDDAETLLPIDLVWLDDAPPPLRERIDAEGIVLYERQRQTKFA